LKYRHLFFDLDHTLWDADTNSAEALKELFQKYELQNRGITSFDVFVAKYKEINEKFWEDYAKGKVNKQTLRYKRFFLTLNHFDIKSYDLSYILSEAYVALAPTKSRLQPYAHEILRYLTSRYTLHIITNGFQDAQYEKLNASNIKKYFKHIITAEKAGYKKPSKAIFDYSLHLTKAKSDESLMIGDNLEIDILGARSAGIDQVYYNLDNKTHDENVSFEICSLLELKGIL
jgi:putative hydrolase of the HAD superfamily